MSMTPSNINEIINSITSSGVAYNNRYEVLINYPTALIQKNYNSIREISVRCESISVPGRSFSTTPYRFYGPARNMPYETTYSGELSMSVIVSADLRERRFFESWMDSICNPFNYKMNYYDQYTTNMEIRILNKTDTSSQIFLVEEVYPKALGEIQLGYDKDNEIMKQEVTLSFRKYQSAYTPYVSTPSINTNSIRTDSQSQYIKGTDGLHRVNFQQQTVDGVVDPARLAELAAKASISR